MGLICQFMETILRTQILYELHYQDHIYINLDCIIVILYTFLFGVSLANVTYQFLM
jgi:hypothetical protein